MTVLKFYQPSPEQDVALQKLARRNSTTTHDLIAMALDEFLKKHHALERPLDAQNERELEAFAAANNVTAAVFVADLVKLSQHDFEQKYPIAKGGRGSFQQFRDYCRKVHQFDQPGTVEGLA